MGKPLCFSVGIPTFNQGEYLEETGGYPVGMESFGDWPMFMQVAPYGSFIYESEIVSRYRIHRTDRFRQRLGMWLRDDERRNELKRFAAGERFAPKAQFRGAIRGILRPNAQKPNTICVAGHRVAGKSATSHG